MQILGQQQLDKQQPPAKPTKPASVIAQKLSPRQFKHKKPTISKLNFTSLTSLHA